MKLRDLIGTLRMEHDIKIRDEAGYDLFKCSSSSPVLDYYFNREVVEWFAYGECKVVISIGGNDEKVDI